MTSVTVVGAVSGLVLGGLAGALLGYGIQKREPSLERGVAPELGAILGGLAGAVMLAAIVAPKSQQLPA